MPCALLDTAFVVPGTNIRFGIDALIGLVAGLGDMITTALSLYIVQEARASGAPRTVGWPIHSLGPRAHVVIS